jgi:hypothetical protein
VKRIQMVEPKVVKDRAYGHSPLDLPDPDVFRAQERRR